MEDKLKIIPYKDPLKKRFKHPVPKELGLSNTFSQLLVGGTGAGKSTIIRNEIRIINYKNIKKPNRFIFASTWEDDNTLHGKFYDENVFKEYSDEVFDNLVEMIKDENNKRDKKGKRREQYLIVLDDMLGLIPKSASIWKTFVRNRHANLNILISVQQYKSVPPVTRFNSITYIIFSTINRKELENIDMELNKKYPNDLFKEKFLQKVQGYDFLFINVPKQLYLINFKEPLITEEELQNYNKLKGKTINEKSKLEPIDEDFPEEDLEGFTYSG